MVSYILFKCCRRLEPKKTLYRELINAGVLLLTAVDDALEARFFSEPKAMLALLHFFGSIDLFGDTTHTAREAELGDQWGWEAL